MINSYAWVFRWKLRPGLLEHVASARALVRGETGARVEHLLTRQRCAARLSPLMALVLVPPDSPACSVSFCG
jgi:hypothetical protein